MKKALIILSLSFQFSVYATTTLESCINSLTQKSIHLDSNVVPLKGQSMAKSNSSFTKANIKELGSSSTMQEKENLLRDFINSFFTDVFFLHHLEESHSLINNRIDYWVSVFNRNPELYDHFDKMDVGVLYAINEITEEEQEYLESNNYRALLVYEKALIELFKNIEHYDRFYQFEQRRLEHPEFKNPVTEPKSTHAMFLQFNLFTTITDLSLLLQQGFSIPAEDLFKIAIYNAFPNYEKLFFNQFYDILNDYVTLPAIHSIDHKQNIDQKLKDLIKKMATIYGQLTDKQIKEAQSLYSEFKLHLVVKPKD